MSLVHVDFSLWANSDSYFETELLILSTESAKERGIHDLLSKLQA